MNTTDAKHGSDSQSQKFRPGRDWIEIDHASDNVVSGPVVDEEVFEYFHVRIDPDDDRNAWLEPKPGVELIGKEVCDEESDDDNCFSYRQRLLLPDGHEAVLIYEDASVGDDSRLQGEYRVVKIEVSNQLAFETMSWLGRQALQHRD
jgi:hypothetical protein